jgi:sugar fermentation stimulation protein A
VKFGERLVTGTFLARRKMFLVDVEVEGESRACFLPNPGRLPELLVPGAPALVAEPTPIVGGPERRTRHDLVAVQYGDHWVSVDTRLPNALFPEAHAAGAIPELARTKLVRAEVKHGASRFDFLLESRSGRPMLLEVKSVTLCEDGEALFPDAPTVRGARHLRELAAARKDGFDVVAFFCVQRPDVHVVRPFDARDPDFGLALREAKRAGVKLLAYRCTTSAAEITITEPVPIELPRLARRAVKVVRPKARRPVPAS